VLQAKTALHAARGVESTALSAAARPPRASRPPEAVRLLPTPLPHSPSLYNCTHYR